MRISDWSSDVCSSDLMAQEIIERLHEMMRQTGEQPLALTGELRVGASNTIGNYLVGDLLGPFVALHPAVSLHVSVENTDTIAAGLLAHRIDVGCLEGPVNHPQLEVQNGRAPVRESMGPVVQVPGVAGPYKKKNTNT